MNKSNAHAIAWADLFVDVGAFCGAFLDADKLSSTRLCLLTNRRGTIRYFNIVTMQSSSNFLTITISKKIYLQLQQINNLLDQISSSSKSSPNDMLNILDAVSKEMPKLFTLLSESFKTSDNASAEALKQSFRFPGSQQEVKLFVILAYIYTLVFEIESKAFYTLINDDKHIEYANKVIRLNESGLGHLI